MSKELGICLVIVHSRRVVVTIILSPLSQSTVIFIPLLYHQLEQITSNSLLGVRVRLGASQGQHAGQDSNRQKDLHFDGSCS